LFVVPIDTPTLNHGCNWHHRWNTSPMPAHHVSVTTCQLVVSYNL